MILERKDAAYKTALRRGALKICVCMSLCIASWLHVHVHDLVSGGSKLQLHVQVYKFGVQNCCRRPKGVCRIRPGQYSCCH